MSLTNIGIGRDRITSDLQQAFPGTTFSYHAQGKGAVIFKAVSEHRQYAMRVTNLQKNLGPIRSRESLRRVVATSKSGIINRNAMLISRATGDSTYDVYSVGFFVATKDNAFVFESKSGKAGAKLTRMLGSIPIPVLEGRKRVYGFMQLEWLEGKDLSDMERDGDHLAKEQRKKLRATLAKFWKAGFRHNDLVGANIMWIPSQSRFVIVDLDTARGVKKTQTRSMSMQEGESEGAYLRRQQHPDANFYEASIEQRMPIMFV